MFSLFDPGDRWKMAGILAMMIIGSLLEVVGIGMIPGFVAIVASPDQVFNYGPIQGIIEGIGITSSTDLLFWGGGALIVVFAVKNLFFLAYYYVESKFISRQKYVFNTRLMSAYMKAPYTFHLQRNSSEMLRNIINETDLLTSGVLVSLLKILREGIITIAILSFLLFIEPLNTLLVFVVLGSAVGFFLLATQKRVRLYGGKEQGYRKDMINYLNQGLGGIKEARVLNREENFIERFRRATHDYSIILAFRKIVSQIHKPIIETVAVTGMIAIAFIMVWQGRAIDSVIPVLSLFAMATVRMMPAFQTIASYATQFQYNLVSVDAIHHDLTELGGHESALNTERDDEKSVNLHDRIEIRDVSFRYSDTEGKAVDQATVIIPRGDMVAFVGSSGAGKTTMVDLLLGLLNPDEGSIMVDGTDIRENISGWQKNIGYIPQSIFLSDETLRKNIAFGVPDEELDEERVWTAVRKAQLTEFVEELPKGLDTVAGEHGAQLSGGQRQRVGIARALYHDPQVLVMDEATSSLDNITEKYVLEALDRLRGNRTIIMIAHRLTTVRSCDQLFFMEHGQIIDRGKYQELLDRNPQFREMALEE